MRISSESAKISFCRSLRIKLKHAKGKALRDLQYKLFHLDANGLLRKNSIEEHLIARLRRRVEEYSLENDPAVDIPSIIDNRVIARYQDAATHRTAPVLVPKRTRENDCIVFLKGFEKECAAPDLRFAPALTRPQRCSTSGLYVC